MRDRGVCDRGHAWQGAVHGMGGAWQGGVHGRGCAWQGDMCGRGACMAGGACVPRMPPPPPPDTTGYGRSMRGQYALYWNAFLLADGFGSLIGASGHDLQWALNDNVDVNLNFMFVILDNLLNKLLLHSR